MDEEARYQIWLRGKIKDICEKINNIEKPDYYFWVPSDTSKIVDEEFWNLLEDYSDMD